MGYNQVADGPVVVDEVVAVDFTPVDEGTLVEMHHYGIPDDGVAAPEHGRSIDATFDYLARLVEG